MKQLYQNTKTGEIQVVDIPDPAVRPGTLLVRNTCSVISPGTERSSVTLARSSYLKTARARPDLVRRVLDTVKREGVLAAYRKVQSKLSEPRPLGYSSAGVVEAVGPGAGDHFQVGDRVACAGAGIANHAETICVPVNLAARVPDGVAMESAAFSTLGAIALHGVRQSDPTLGERIAVVGLGILGLLTVQLLRANGVRVAAFDLAPDLVERARSLGAETGIAGSTEDQVSVALSWTEGLGVDAAIVTAASSSDAPMVAAAGMCRDRGRVVAVGLVPFGIPREIAFEKELDLRISRSYGPGRYDPNFEEKGIDYPPGYVRWTQTRNLEAFLRLLSEGRVSLESLITHRYALTDAPRAYDELVSKEEKRALGMIIDYPEAPRREPAAPPQAPVAAAAGREAVPVTGDIGVAFIGAGGFARSVLLPQFKGRQGVALRTVVTAHGLTADDVRKKFGFREAGTDAEQAIADPSTHLICIATRHDLHAELVVRALQAGKHVFVEKPLALTNEQLAQIEDAASKSPGLVLAGFNRRFSPMARAVRDAVAERAPLVATYRINAGPLPAGHWVNDPDQGGGRMIGEGCHFVDLLSFLTGDREIEDVQARCAGRPRGTAEDLAVQVSFADGSVGQILYTARGSGRLGKERLEAHAGGVSAVIDDYHSCTIHKGSRSTKVKKPGKGHAEEVSALIEAVRRGGPSPIPLDVLARVTRATFDVQRLLAAPGAPERRSS
jgi:predicted dehydrogenase/threonine dehydrogenase-like Zn-dependent dehydrogenase